jgi:hypothetical protein
VLWWPGSEFAIPKQDCHQINLIGRSEWRSGKIEINITSEVVGSIPGQTHSSCDGEGDSLRQRRFPPRAPVSSYMH